MLKLYGELAVWWPLLSPVEQYADEAETFTQILTEAGLPAGATLLELGAGGGHNAFYLKKLFAQVTLTDLSPQMLAMSQQINPECTHVVGDMCSLRLGQLFEVVFIHDAIEYMSNVEMLEQALTTAFIHLRPGGLVLIVPDEVQETFEPVTEHGGDDGDDGRAIRFLEWSYDPDPADNSYITVYAYLLREPDGSIHMGQEKHLLGCFSLAQWLNLLEKVGFRPEVQQDSYGRYLFLGRK